MGMMTNRDNNRSVTSSPAPPKAVVPRRASVAHNSAANASSTPPPSSSLEDPEYFQRIMHSRYPEHMLYCPQTSLYPIFFFLMERWEARREAAKQIAAPAPSDSQE